MTKADLQIQPSQLPITTLLNALVSNDFSKVANQDTGQQLPTCRLDSTTPFILVLEPKPSTTATRRCPAVVNTHSDLASLLQQGEFEFNQCQLFLPYKTLTMIATAKSTLIKLVSLLEPSDSCALLRHTPYLLSDSGRFDNETITKLQTLSNNSQLKFITVETTKKSAELLWEGV